MKVYIVRHGQVSSNALGRYNRKEDDLTEKGIMQAEELRDNIKQMDFDIIISSPLIRALHTADIINCQHKKIVVDERLKERNVGSLAGQPLTVTNREEYWNYNTKIKYGTEEDIKDFFKRVFQFLDELKGKEYQSALIVAHSGVSKAFNAYFEGIQDGMFLNRGLENCEIKEYQL